jgi:hypothetical protein
MSCLSIAHELKTPLVKIKTKGYAGVSSDVCDFKAALDSATPNFATAKALYNAGKNSKKSDGSMRTFKGLAVSTAAGDEPFANVYSAYFGTPSYIQDFVDAGFSGTAPLTTPQARAEALQKVRVFVYACRQERGESVTCFGPSVRGVAHSLPLLYHPPRADGRGRARPVLLYARARRGGGQDPVARARRCC